jgi:hypothetical protein
VHPADVAEVAALAVVGPQSVERADLGLPGAAVGCGQGLLECCVGEVLQLLPLQFVSSVVTVPPPSEVTTRGPETIEAGFGLPPPPKDAIVWG